MSKPLLEDRNEEGTIPRGEDTPAIEETIVEVIVLPPLDATRVYIRSPRLAYPEHAAFFVKQMIPE